VKSVIKEAPLDGRYGENRTREKERIAVRIATVVAPANVRAASPPTSEIVELKH
jgi:hypothetical protein